MCSSAHEIEIADALRPIVKPEPSRLAKQWRDRKPGTIGAQVVVAEVLGRHVKVARDTRAKARQDRSFERCDDACLQARPLDSPIDRTFQIWHRAQHVKAVAPLGCETDIGGRRAMQVEGKILRQNPVVKDVGEQFAVALTEPDGVVRDVRILTGRAEVQDEQPHGKRGSGKF